MNGCRIILVIGLALHALACREACVRNPAVPGSAHPAIEKAQADYRPGEVIVKFRPGTSKEAVQTLAKKFHLRMIRPFSVPDLYLFHVEAEVGLEELLPELNNAEEIEYAEPNFTRKLN